MLTCYPFPNMPLLIRFIELNHVRSWQFNCYCLIIPTPSLTIPHECQRLQLLTFSPLPLALPPSFIFSASPSILSSKTQLWYYTFTLRRNMILHIEGHQTIKDQCKIFRGKKKHVNRKRLHLYTKRQLKRKINYLEWYKNIWKSLSISIVKMNS